MVTRATKEKDVINLKNILSKHLSDLGGDPLTPGILPLELPEIKLDTFSDIELEGFPDIELEEMEPLELPPIEDILCPKYKKEPKK